MTERRGRRSTGSPWRLTALAAAVMAITILSATGAAAKQYSAWASPASVETLPGSSSEVNTSFLDGCPIVSPDGLDLYMASTRSPGGQGGIDIWVAHRSSTDVGFGTPVNLGPSVNSSADDFCPTPVPGHGLYFVSSRGGNPDIYFTRNNPVSGWRSPAPITAVNSALPEFSPSYIQADGRTFLYFSRGPDIYSAELQSGSWGSVGPVAELNSAMDDFRPNARKDGLEIVFDSNRGGQGGQDLYFATRASISDPWSAPLNAGPGINTSVNETRGSLSRDAETLYFGRAPAPEGASDIYFTTRSKVAGD